ncbi:MAG: hypothetical protein KatS3mg087_1659 [Patescibacteria group bacterium]|nr:MAG: hypothetical protein KatS3mg087_1659 [Patescibacteria group bacterium]
MNSILEIAEAIYEATRQEAIWSKRDIVPEPFNERDQAFKEQFVNTVEDYLKRDQLPSPEEAHNDWVRAYEQMGWKYGKVRDVVNKTHPDLVPYSELSKSERDKDAIFLMAVLLAKMMTGTK